MNWTKWWSVAEGIDIHSERGDGFFSLTAKQARPNWFAFAFGLLFAVISFSIAAHMSDSTPPEPIMFWFFLIFGIFGFLFALGDFSSRTTDGSQRPAWYPMEK